MLLTAKKKGTPLMADKKETVDRIRRFNRFYMACIRVMDRTYLDSEYSVTESRILYELYENGGCSAKYIAGKLNIDKSYLSRILKKFIEKGLIKRAVSKEDSRSFSIRLTDKGKKLIYELNERSDKQIGELLAELTNGECGEICSAMDIITSHLSRK